MSYSDTITYLFDLQKFGIKLGLSKTTSLLKCLGNPHKKLRCIHIAGSNGKGSTAAFLLSILKQSGYKAGFYSSPHLIDFTERIRINDQPIERMRVVFLTEEIKRLCKKHSILNITFFEFVTALAFKYFEEQEADPVIVEVGMGGRFDATNVIKPLTSIITSISLEHQIYLGRTLSEIAREKAGIIKRGVPVICGVQQPKIKKFIRQTCQSANAPLYQLGSQIRCRINLQAKNVTNPTLKTLPVADEANVIQCFNYKGLQSEFKGLQCGLIGDHQIRNASMAIAASELLQKKGYPIKPEEVTAGIRQTAWPGRLEVIKKNPTIILDGAHNPDAWKSCRRALENNFKYEHLVLLLGVMEDKDIFKMINFLTPSAYAVIFCRPQMERAAKKEYLQKYITFSDIKKIFWVENSTRAFMKALSLSSKKDLICVTGSLFVVGEIREYLKKAGANSSGRIPM